MTLACVPYPDLVAMLATEYAQVEFARGAESRGGVVVTFVSPNGTWTLVVIPPDPGPLMGCPVASGDHFMAIVGELG